MYDVAYVKALLMQSAYTGAAAVCEPLINEPGAPTPIPVDPLIADAGLQAKGVMVYEEAKVQYAAILRAFQDKTGIWPDPVLPAGTAVPPQPSANPAGKATPTPSTGQAAPTAAVNPQVIQKFAQAVAGVAQSVEPVVPGAELLSSAAAAVANTAGQASAPSTGS
jgi:hypothetical protein